jgi:hypothetical protein
VTTYRQTSDDLVQKLREQLGFLRTSAARFDAGEVSEATRLAMPIRVLVYDTRASHSLLGQLGVKANLRFFDTAYDIPPAEHKQVGPNQYTATARFAFPLGPGHIVGDEAGPRYEFRAPLAKHRVSALRSFDD